MVHKILEYDQCDSSSFHDSLNLLDIVKDHLL